jgi:hypothetical protein
MLIPGEQLEKAVRVVEEAIIATDPNLRERSFTLDLRKRVVIEGVQHEIDVWVTLGASHDYDAIFIFECKDWKRPVSKKEVIVLAEKVRAVSAQRGFLVARNFTKSAYAQSLQDNRIQLVQLSDPPTFDRIEWIVFTRGEPNCSVEFLSKKGRWWPPSPYQTLLAVLNGQPLKIRNYLNLWLTEILENLTKEFQAENKSSVGVSHTLKARSERGFSELRLGGTKIVKMILRVELRVANVRPTIVSKYEIASRGRFWAFSPVEVTPGQFLEISIAKPI